MPSRNRLELKSFIRFQLSQLSARNAHHDFENLAFEVARIRVVPNILPATGPVQAGGDQGRDFESYRTYLANSHLGTSAFAAKASSDIIVGACSLQKNITDKIRADLKSIFGAGTHPGHVAYFCEADVPVAKRHELQEFCKENYGATLDIFDGQAIADILAEHDTAWIAEQFLSIPADEWPADSTSEEYQALKTRWITQREKPQNYAEFLDVKQGLRTATFEPSAKPDLLSWLCVMRDFVSDDLPDRLVQKARYEISVAELRGRGSLDPALPYVDKFFDSLSGASSPSELMDGAILCVYVWGAVGHKQTSTTADAVSSWRAKVDGLLDTALSSAGRVIDRCTLLEAKATLSPVSPEERLTSTHAANRFFDLWGNVVKQIQATPYYPVRHVANILEQVTPFLGTHPRFRPIADDVDLLVADRAGAGAAADLARRRAIAHLKANRNLAAINELQKAKVGWFSGETMDGSMLSMLVISDSLSKLNLNFAARYYAAGALFLALNHQDETLKHRIGHAFFSVADTFHAAGEGISYFHVLAHALEAHHSVASNPHDWYEHSHVQRSFAQATTLRAIARRLDPSTLPLIDQAIASWPLPESEQRAFIDLSERPPWSTMSRSEVEARIAEELGLHPFGDIGARSAVWSALGIVWAVKGAPTRECWLAVSELAAVLQLAQVEFGDADLVVIPSNVTIDVELQDVERSRVEQLPDNGRLAWRVIMPTHYARDHDKDYGFELASVAITILGQTTALPFEKFRQLVDERFERGMSHRFFSVRPIRELLEFVQPQELPLALLANTDRRKLSVDVRPIEPDELKWRSAPGPGYSKNKAEEMLRNRYEKTRAAVLLTLPRLLKDDRCRKIIEGLRSEGLLDWQILNIVTSVVTQWQVQAQFPNCDPRELARQIQDRVFRAESVSDPEFDLNVFSAEVVKMQGRMLSMAALKSWGLEIHRRTPDFEATKKLLDVRYRHSLDDLPHGDPFSLEVEGSL
ncbi:hypothetical protein [Bradyrhizobium brasilense]|uniref:Uncharacterized protein n=1 Tax=Bradyrhizobium brasilense TaxID=1419277 RepID=A0A1G7FL61_9BRAD|nr:hypothetical protein [Bradyrhizobium brasilense]MCC8976240.1 hypothetical protein [Bradyrhizobium brasilense]SDE76598.1 hypothetical protein SAMN05216337_103456 [Bradyrhizobium brasilense]